MSATVMSATAVRPSHRRAVFGAALVAGATAGLLVGARSGVAAGDAELLHLLRAMAVLKLAFVAAGAAAVLWRLQAPVRPAMLAAYAAAAAAMAAGPGLIWFEAHIIAASILLHGGIAACLILLWRDGETGRLLERAWQARRARLRE